MLVRPCGLCRTSVALGEIPAGRLVYFHNHSDQGPPIVQLPAENRNNRWRFETRGRLLKEQSEIDSLVTLKREGIYFTREHFHPQPGQTVAKHALVQLGYNRDAEPIIFFPSSVEDGNALTFPASGMKIGTTVFELLEPLEITGPRTTRAIH